MDIDLTKAGTIGQNVRALTVNGLLILVIDPKVELGMSGSGKSMMVATTSGNVTVGGILKLGLNMYKKPGDK